MTAAESYDRRLSLQEFWSWSWISDEPPSFSLKIGTKAHTQNMAKWPREKLKQKTMWVKKVVEALVDSWRGTQRLFPPKYTEKTFRLSKLLNSMRRHVIITTVRSYTGQLESSRSKLQGLQDDSFFPRILIFFLIPSLSQFRIRKF